MSFDQEPEHRYLIYHAESDSLFETYDGSMAEMAIGEGDCDDVTGIEKFEQMFKEQKNGNKSTEK